MYDCLFFLNNTIMVFYTAICTDLDWIEQKISSSTNVLPFWLIGNF